MLIPSWVNVEINDSTLRPSYLQELREIEINVYIIDETEYIDLANDEELNILYITMYSTNIFSQIYSFMNKSIIKNQSYEDIDYEFKEWINILYNNWPILGSEVGQMNNRRMQKKNAGEVSISILARILSYYFPKLESITLLTFDKDCYNCIYDTQHKFNKDNNFKNRDCTSITFKSNDLILYELVKNNLYTIDYIKGIINDIRTPRRIKFSRRKEDNSFEEKFNNIDNSTLIDMICDDSLHIIF